MMFHFAEFAEHYNGPCLLAPRFSQTAVEFIDLVLSLVGFLGIHFRPVHYMHAVVRDYGSMVLCGIYLCFGLRPESMEY